MTSRFAPRYAAVRSVFASLLIVTAFSLSILLAGCTDPCWVPAQITDETVAPVRFFNAMADRTMVTVYIDGKLFLKDYTYTIPSSVAVSGYHQTYPDNSPLTIGEKTFKVYSDTTRTLLLDSQVVNITARRQTLVLMGRGVEKVSTDQKSARIVRLQDDEDVPAEGRTKARFIHAIPDLPAIDVYFADTVKPTGPDVTFHYGEATSYQDVKSANGLLITYAGDPKKEILRVPTPLSAFSGLLATVVIRGLIYPCDTEYVVSSSIINDAPKGNSLISIETFNVRYFNGSREDTMSIWIKQLNHNKANGIDSNDYRNNIPRQRQVIMDMAPAALGEYLGLNPTFASKARYFLSTGSDYVWNGGVLIPPVMNDSMQVQSRANQRFTLVSYESQPLSTGVHQPRLLRLVDTLSCGDDHHTPVRFVNINPDLGDLTFKFNGVSHTLKLGESIVLEGPVGDQTVGFEGSAIVRTITVKAGRPANLYFMPDLTGQSKLVHYVDEGP